MTRLRRAATADQPPVRTLLLHGLGGSTASWDEFVRCAGPELELWEAELPWHAMGDNRWSRHGAESQWITQAVAAVPGGVDVVVAHSFAANLVLAALATGAVRPRTAVVLISPYYRRSTEDFTWTTLEAYVDGLVDVLDEGLRIKLDGRVSQDVRRLMATRMRDRIGPYGWMRFFESYLRTPLLDLTGIQLPVLVVSGLRDVSAGRSDGQALAAALPDGRFELFEDCGHFPATERPDGFAAVLGHLLSTAPRGALT